MKTQALYQSFEMLLLAAGVILLILALVYALHTPGPLASVGWNNWL